MDELPAPVEEDAPRLVPRLPVYLDADLLEALAQTLDPSGVPGTRRVKTTQMGRTLEGRGYAVRAGGRFGTRLLGAVAGGERTRDVKDEAADELLEEQEFIVREATLLWQAHSLLAEEGLLKSVSAPDAANLAAGDWVELRLKSTGRSLLSLARLASRLVEVLSTQGDQRLSRLREGEALLRGAKHPAGTKIGELTVSDARALFFSDLVASLAAGTNAEQLLTFAAVDGFADEIRNGVISDITAEFTDAQLGAWKSVLTVRTADYERLAAGVLRDAEFGVFGKVSLVRTEGEPLHLVRRTMLDWLDPATLSSLSSDLQTSLGWEALVIEPPLLQILPLAIWL